jgi:hypothetical protein
LRRECRSWSRSLRIQCRRPSQCDRGNRNFTRRLLLRRTRTRTRSFLQHSLPVVLQILFFKQFTRRPALISKNLEKIYSGYEQKFASLPKNSPTILVLLIRTPIPQAIPELLKMQAQAIIQAADFQEIAGTCAVKVVNVFREARVL